ncbi:MAG: hypothetical protein U5R49_08595 [Deltaproteobacteria bacterium]|nr:hypothetical protein [Deltaproteobacteria bacterium]
MKTTLTAIMITVFFLTPALCFSAYRIHLKDGREFVTDRYWLEGGQIKFKRFGGVIGIQKELVREIEEVEDIPEQGAPTKREKAGEAKKTEVAKGAETGDQENIGEKGAGTSKPGTASGDAPRKIA